MAAKETFFLFIVILCWGITPFLEKTALTRNIPLDGLYIRTLTVFVIFTLYYAVTGRLSRVALIPAKDTLLFGLGGVLAGFIGMIFYFKMLKISPVSKTTPLASTYPLVTALIAFTIFGEHPSWQRLLGTILIVAGILLVK